MGNLDDKIAAKRREKKSKRKKKRRSNEEDVAMGLLKSPPGLLVAANQATKFSSSSGDSSSSSRGKSSKDDCSSNYDVSTTRIPATTLPGAYAVKSTDQSAAERLKFSSSYERESTTKPGAFRATHEDHVAAERLKFGMMSAEKPLVKPGAFSSTIDDLSAAERLKFGLVSNAEALQAPAQAPPTQAPRMQAPAQVPGAFSMSNNEISAAERLKFGIAQQEVHLSEFSQSYESILTNDNWKTQNNEYEDNNEVIEAEVVSRHDFDNLSQKFDIFAWLEGQLDPKQRRTLFTICSVVSFIIIISLSAALDSAKRNLRNNAADPKQQTIVPSPTPPPIDVSWCFNSTEHVENVRYASLRSALVNYGLSADSEFATNDSYQRKSLCWLAFGDALQIDESDPFLEQRYALATIFYSLSEPNKLLSSGWLSGKQECNWEPMVQCDSRTGSTVSKLNIAGFDLEGRLPKELSSLRYVTHLDLSDNRLKGGVTEATTGWNKLQELRLANNIFESFPERIDFMMSMTHFDISANNISGKIPVFLTFMSNLIYMDISSNSFSGTIPEYMGGNLPSLYSLYMHSNGLTGEMPQSICGLRGVNLKHLSVDCGGGDEIEGRNVDCDVPECCTVCNGYII